MKGGRAKVDWRKLLYANLARPRALFTLWMACHAINIFVSKKINQYECFFTTFCLVKRAILLLKNKTNHSAIKIND